MSMPMMALHVASPAGTPAAKRFMPRIVSAIALVESPEATPAMWLSMGAKARGRMLRASGGVLDRANLFFWCGRSGAGAGGERGLICF